jgi:hypothetical protein
MMKLLKLTLLLGPMVILVLTSSCEKSNETTMPSHTAPATLPISETAPITTQSIGSATLTVTLTRIQTLAPTASATVTPSITPFATATSTQTSTPSQTSNPTMQFPALGYEVLVPGDCCGDFFAVVNSDKIGIIQRGGILVWYEGGYPTKRISLEDAMDSTVAFAVTQEAIWILNLAEMPTQIHELVQLGPDGVITARYKLPNRLFWVAGEYDTSTGVYRLLTNPDGDLFLEGRAGYFQLRGTLQAPIFEKVAGVSYQGTTYTVERHLTRLPVQVGVVEVGGKRIEVTTDLDHIYIELAGLAPDGSFYVLSEEYAENSASHGPQRMTVRHYSAEGNLINLASLSDILGSYVSLAYTVGQDGNFYIYVSWLDFSPHVIQVRFHEP